MRNLRQTADYCLNQLLLLADGVLLLASFFFIFGYYSA